MTTPTFDITAHVIEHLHQKFLKDGNPLHVWQAYRWTRRPPRPLPDWIAAYFDNCAAALLGDPPPDPNLNILDQVQQKEPPSRKFRKPASAEEALGLAIKGGHSKYRQLADASRDFGIFSRVDLEMRMTRDDLPDDEDLTKDERAQVAKWFAPLLRGESKLDRICERIAEEWQDWGAGAPLEAKSIRDIYFRLKKHEPNSQS